MLILIQIVFEGHIIPLLNVHDHISLRPNDKHLLTSDEYIPEVRDTQIVFFFFF